MKTILSSIYYGQKSFDVKGNALSGSGLEAASSNAFSGKKTDAIPKGALRIRSGSCASIIKRIMMKLCIFSVIELPRSPIYNLLPLLIFLVIDLLNGNITFIDHLLFYKGFD